MHQAEAWQVPTLNGEPYSHKPPLLFWLFRGGWEILGVSAWWPRLAQALAGALALLLAARLARALAPDRPGAGPVSALLLGGTVAFQAYSSLLFFDLWLTVFVLLGWLGLLRACGPEAPAARRGWAIFALALAAALLTKGPAAALSLLPALLLRPLWWGPVPRPMRFAIGADVAPAAGCALALPWALPAAAAGGPDYADAILLGQTASRLSETAEHARPFWWYAALLPALLAPAALWPGLWRRSSDFPQRLVRFGACVFLPAFLAFSLIPGKQPHYLLPAIPALALLGASRAPASGPTRALSVCALAAPLLALVLNLGISLAWGSQYRVEAPAAAIAAAQEGGRSVAFYGMTYHGQFHFAGRLRAPLANPPNPRALREWLAEHPDGLVVLVLDSDADPRLEQGAEASHALGTRRAALWRASALAAIPYPPRARDRAAAD
jgi:4-amino-4-deoxy-L-arabinose transferase-like glycosyltransferase